MKNMFVSCRCAGFTVVEMMVSMTIGLLVTALVAVVFAGSTATYRLSDTNAELIETGRNALDAMERDVRMAGFRGCNTNNLGASAPFVNTIVTPTTHNDNYAVGIQVHNSTGGPGVFAPALTSVPAGIIGGSDALVVRVPTGPVLPVTATMAGGTAAITLAAATLAVGDRAVIASCSNAAAFIVTGIAGTDLQHAAGADNATDNLGTAFDIDAVVIPFVTRTYFLAPSSTGVAGENSLWVRENTGAATELAENVEQMQILVGEDSDADMVTNRFRNVTAATNFNNVLAIQIHLQTRGNRNSETTSNLNYRFAGAAVVATDRFARRSFTSTILLRNRTL